MFGVGEGHSGLGARLRQRCDCRKGHRERKQQKTMNTCLCLEKKGIRYSCKDNLDER